MGKIYYDTPQRVYKLLKNHPVLAQLYAEFNISMDGMKAVAQFLNVNHDKIMATDLKAVYNTETPDTLEADQGEVFTIVETYENLPPIGDETTIYHIQYPEPGFYYEWNGDGYREVPKSKEMSGAAFVSLMHSERRYKIWDDEKGIFVKTEDGDWVQVDEGEYIGSVIRKSELPQNAEPGDVYKVIGEDLLDCLAVLYGIGDRGFNPPWSNYISSAPAHSPLLELLYMTIYLYKFGVTDNFYEKNLWEFLPEYDRLELQANPKMKLLVESIGRKMDQMEDQLMHLESVYDIDDTPEHLLNHLGQMLGYEKEDFTLSDMSFRELLKNIIEIYKIKGTNYSFSFFFKFLGFNINLKEFYFNRDVINPENFPNMNEEKVEWYLTTTNPMYETEYGMPVDHLGTIRNITDFETEKESLLKNGCDNIIPYMLGREPYNNAKGEEERWHNNPWSYFKTNLVEYGLSPFFDKINLTSQDNETIKKYIKFLSPTYIFTWISVDIAPWIDSYDFGETTKDNIFVNLQKTLGDWKNDKYVDHDALYDYLYTNVDGKLVPWTESDTMFTNLTNNMNKGGDDQIGTVINRTGIHSRLLSSPNFIATADHSGKKFIAIDRLYLRLLVNGNTDYRTDVHLNNGPGPLIATIDPNPDGTIPLLFEGDLAKGSNNQYYTYVQSNWVESGDDRTHLDDENIKRQVNNFSDLLILETIDTKNVYHVAEDDKKCVCYQYVAGYLSQVYKPADIEQAAIWDAASIKKINGANLTNVILNNCLGIVNGIYTAHNLLLDTTNVYCVGGDNGNTYWKYKQGYWTQTNYYIVEKYYDLYLILAPQPEAVYYVKENNTKYKFVITGHKPERNIGFNNSVFKFDDGTEYGKDINVKATVTWNQLLSIANPNLTDYYRVSDAPGYTTPQCYYFVKNWQWAKAFDPERRFNTWMDYSTDAYPTIPVKMTPASNSNFFTSTISFSWSAVYEQYGYWVQIARKDNFSKLLYEEIFYNGTRDMQNLFFENDSYSWRLRVKNRFVMTALSSNNLNKMLSDHPELSEYFNAVEMTLTVDDRVEYDRVISIMAEYGLKFDWGSWTVPYNFNINALPFPHDKQVLNDLHYTKTIPIMDSNIGYFIGFKFKLEWEKALNLEYYELQITYDEELTNIHTVIRLTANTFEVTMVPGTYYWRTRIKALNKTISDWCQLLSFTIPPASEIIT